MASTTTPVKKARGKAKPKVKLTDLDPQAYEALMAQARDFIKKENQPRGGEPMKIAHQNYVLECGHLITMLAPPVRFSVMSSNEIEDLDFKKPPTKPTKPLSNTALTRTFCGFSKDSTPNKLWRKGNG